MIIRKLRVSNFKSIKRLTLDCKKVNIFIGEPNTGKSNILETIGLLSHAGFGRPLRNFVRFENLVDLFYDRNLSEPIEIEFDSEKLVVAFQNGSFSGKFETSAETGTKNIKHVRDIFSYDFQGTGHHMLTHVRDIQTLQSFKYYKFANKDSYGSMNSEFLEPPGGDNLLSVLLSRKDLKTIVANLFKKYGYRVVFKPQERKMEVQKEQDDIIVSVPYSLSSETLQRIIFYLAAVYSNKNSVISFEEPEAHAFPYYMKYLAENVAMDKANNQYFVATHNPYFLMSIIEKTPKEEIATFATYFEDYETKVRALSPEETENALSMGPDLFFNIDQFLRKDECIGT